MTIRRPTRHVVRRVRQGRPPRALRGASCDATVAVRANAVHAEERRRRRSRLRSRGVARFRGCSRRGDVRLASSCKRPGSRAPPSTEPIDLEDTMSEPGLVDITGRLRSPAATPGHRAGCVPPNKELRHPADPPTVEEIILVIREAGPGPYADRTRGLIAILCVRDCGAAKRPRSPSQIWTRRPGRCWSGTGYAEFGIAHVMPAIWLCRAWAGGQRISLLSWKAPSRSLGIITPRRS